MFPFLISAALAATTLSAFTDQGPPPPVRYHHEYNLIRFDRDSWTVSDTLIGTDGTRRKMGTTSSDWTPTGTAWLVDMLTGYEEAQGPAMTPAQKKKQIQDAGIETCCGTVTTPPCENFCFCNIVVWPNPDGSAGGSSTFCLCKEDAQNEECPDDTPNGSA